MRIDPFNSSASQISSDPSSPQVSSQKIANAGQSSEDRATLSSDSTSVNSLVSTALSSPEIRQDKVDSLQQAISSGQYQIDPGKIASSILNEEA